MVLSHIKFKLKQGFQKLIPFPLQFYLTRKERIRIDTQMRKHRKDIVNFPLGEAAYLQAYWKIHGIGRGPALVLYINGEEVLKFDFYGAEKGHYHIQTIQPAPKRYPALMFMEKSVPEQIDRAIFELENNLYWYLERHPLASVRCFRVKNSTLKSVLTEVRPILLSYAHQGPSEEPSQLSI